MRNREWDCLDRKDVSSSSIIFSFCNNHHIFEYILSCKGQEKVTEPFPYSCHKQAHQNRYAKTTNLPTLQTASNNTDTLEDSMSTEGL
jgi:hypothetical protein